MSSLSHRAADLVIRRAYAPDLELVMALDATDEHTARQATKARVRLAGKILAGDIYLAFLGELPVAYLRYDALWPEMVPLLAWAWVEPAYRGQGIARRVIGFTFDELRRHGVESVLRSACTERPAMIAKLTRECGPPAGRLQFENGVEEWFFWCKL